MLKIPVKKIIGALFGSEPVIQESNVTEEELVELLKKHSPDRITVYLSQNTNDMVRYGISWESSNKVLFFHLKDCRSIWVSAEETFPLIGKLLELEITTPFVGFLFRYSYKAEIDQPVRFL